MQQAVPYIRAKHWTEIVQDVETYFAGVRREVEAGGRRKKTGLARSLERVADDAAIDIWTDQARRECIEAIRLGVMMDAILQGIAQVCQRWDVDLPESTSGKDAEIVNKAMCERWWRRQLRKRAARHAEYEAIKAGFVGKGKQPYISDESCIRQARRNKANRRMLAAASVINEHGQQYSVADLADKGMANKSNRRDELMTRIRGMDEVAETLNHAALFWTVTAPSRFHSVGGTNPKYDGSSPRDAQRYFCGQWEKVRAAFAREGITPYGFRVVEPHTDGCPHWHMLYFVERKHVKRMAEIIERYALEVDGDEPGAKENRVKLVSIGRENGGSAAGYVAKYISKNIDGHEVGQHKAFEHGEEFAVHASDFDGIGTITPSMRVSYWAQVWGIRQFQQIGGVPVGIWREFRRVKAEEVEGAPEYVRQAWDAAQAEKDEAGTVTRQADFAGFMRALGGAQVGRSALVQLYKDDVTIEGAYASYQAKKPIGVHAVTEPDGVIYRSTRYVWRSVSGEGLIAQGVPVFGGPRTGVNNCTQVDYPELHKRFDASTERAAGEVKNKKIKAPLWVDWREIRVQAKEAKKESEKLSAARNKRAGSGGGIVAEGEAWINWSMRR